MQHANTSPISLPMAQSRQFPWENALFEKFAGNVVGVANMVDRQSHHPSDKRGSCLIEDPRCSPRKEEAGDRLVGISLRYSRQALSLLHATHRSIIDLGWFIKKGTKQHQPDHLNPGSGNA